MSSDKETWAGRGDVELLDASRAGDSEAFGALVLRHQDRLYQLAYRLSGNEAEAWEIAQESFLKAYRALGSFRGESGFYTWIYRIALNEFRSRQRFRAVRPMERSLESAARANGEEERSGLKERLAADGPDPSEEAGRAERKAMVEEALARLEREQRAIIVLRDIDGRDYEEIAEILDCPRGTVKSRLHRARMALKELLSASVKSETREGFA